MTDPRQRVRDLYGFDFPVDFFRIQDFLSRLPEDTLEQATDMRPAYAVLAPWQEGGFEHRREDRYYHDLPEFITLFTGSTDGLHWGYFFDAPGQLPPVVAAYWHSDTFEHHIEGDTPFEVIRAALESSVQQMEEDEEEDDERLEAINLVRTTLSDFWGADRPETGVDYVDAYGVGASRQPVAETFSGIGIVAPPETYRPPASDPFSRYEAEVDLGPSQVEALLAEARNNLLAGFPASALKLGHDLWIWAQDYPDTYNLLTDAYRSLGREALIPLLEKARRFRDECDAG